MRIKAYFTIEAAIYIPLLIFTIARGLIMGIDLYVQVKEIAVVDEQILKFEETDFIWKEVFVKGIIERKE